MGYDKNECRFSGQILELKNVATRSGKKMATLKIQCFREQIRACCFENYAEIILENYNTGDNIEFTGKLQSSSWEKNGSRYFSYQINISEIVENEVEKEDLLFNEEERPVRPGQENIDYRGGPF
jgi:single-stranded DNA-binding protein